MNKIEPLVNPPDIVITNNTSIQTNKHKPLSDDQIRKIYLQVGVMDFTDLVRMIEQLHGIY